jgi:acetyl-CoA C-acetyltransferase
LNNYVLQSTARMVQVLRENPGSTGLVSSISGMITKQGMGLWSTTPPAKGFRSADVTGEARADTATAAIDGDYRGAASVVGYTVGYDGPEPKVGIVIGRAIGASTGSDTPVHTVATTTDQALMADLMASEWVGRHVDIDGPTFTG